ncbi:hypothetical protein SLEP1_g32424 [Rubroshorea leprosula]|uniref:Uncharacterized protein n=1 Tax=Rubroshorea leprosula TaxID=152421 RepID=A0AAV5KD82_9ROSI|nr:hypothetical protein SLEP1_g32424 [Rubroshorea leprosula]
MFPPNGRVRANGLHCAPAHGHLIAFSPKTWFSSNAAPANIMIVGPANVDLVMMDDLLLLPAHPDNPCP